MYTAMVVMLIVIFGAALMGKMLKDMYPGSVFGFLNKKSSDDAPASE